MPLTNPGTPFDLDGWADMLSDMRRIHLMIEGGGNDLNNSTKGVTQVSDEYEEVTVRICQDDGEKNMKVLGTRPQ